MKKLITLTITLLLIFTTACQPQQQANNNKAVDTVDKNTQKLSIHATGHENELIYKEYLSLIFKY